jgi:hypothetical protein
MSSRVLKNVLIKDILSMVQSYLSPSDFLIEKIEKIFPGVIRQPETRDDVGNITPAHISFFAFYAINQFENSRLVERYTAALKYTITNVDSKRMIVNITVGDRLAIQFIIGNLRIFVYKIYNADGTNTTSDHGYENTDMINDDSEFLDFIRSDFNMSLGPIDIVNSMFDDLRELFIILSKYAMRQRL